MEFPHRYNYAVLGWIEKVFLTPFWNFAVTLMPMWLAPNLITLFSLLHGTSPYDTVPGQIDLMAPRTNSQRSLFRLFMLCLCHLHTRLLHVCLTPAPPFPGVVGCALLFYHCPTLTEAAPSWVYLVYAWTLFMYQTLDAIDGKQARRTGSSSPLGQAGDNMVVVGR